MLLTIELLKRALDASWCKETAHRKDQPYWSEQNKSRGQCAVTSIVVNNFFGGNIIEGFSEKYSIFHYWNIIDSNKIDFTFSQFIGDKDDIEFNQTTIITPKELLNDHNVQKRYNVLKEKVCEYLSIVDAI